MIVLTLTKNTIEGNIKLTEDNINFIDAVELRADLLENCSIEEIIKFPKLVSKPVILTYRKKIDGGLFDGDESVRAELFKSAARCGFAYFDFEVGFNPIKDSGDTKIIRSANDFEVIPSDFVGFFDRVAANNEIPKLAVTVKDNAQLLEFYKLTKSLGSYEKIVLAMGQVGFSSRVLTHITGSKFSYTSCSGDLSKIGHISPEDLSELYNYRNLSCDSSIFGIIGNPVMHSKSPVIHNSYYKEHSMDAVYIPFLVSSVSSFIELALLLDIKGFSVTAPFKQEIIPFLSNASEDVDIVEACNTVVVNNGELSGFNTDIFGFLNQLKLSVDTLAGKKCAVIGAGGASNAVVYALTNEQASITVFNRTVEKAEKLANAFNCQFDALANFSGYSDFDIIIQSSTAGMDNLKDINPAQGYMFHGSEVCYDLIYAPKHTLFLQQASAANCRCLYGKRMLEDQAIGQFKAFSYKV